MSNWMYPSSGDKVGKNLPNYAWQTKLFTITGPFCQTQLSKYIFFFE